MFENGKQLCQLIPWFSHVMTGMCLNFAKGHNNAKTDRFMLCEECFRNNENDLSWLVGWLVLGLTAL